ncbi:MAG: phosphatase PAP2 family protein [Candidatus Helarchaeota archaeon]
MEKFERGIEKAFFKGKSSGWSKWLSFMIVNVILMLLIFYVFLNSIAYDWTGSIYPVWNGFRLDFLGDNLIPFIPEFSIIYVYVFFTTVISTMVYFGFFDTIKGYALAWSLVLINLIAVIIYVFFPVSTFFWRLGLWLSQWQYQNVWAGTMFEYYTIDTSFNCFPSLHAAVSTIIFYAWYRYAKIEHEHPRAPPKWLRNSIAVITFVIAILVMLSTLFVKQHYIVDEISGFLLAIGVGKLVFDYLWKDFET